MNGHAVPDMDAFLAVIRTIGDATDVRLRCVDLQDRKRVFTLRTDLHYWPTVELRRQTPAEAAAPGAESGDGGAAASAVSDLGNEWRLVRHRPVT